LLTTPKAATCGCFGDLFSDLAPRRLWYQCGFDVIMLTLLVAYILLVRAARAPAARGGVWT
jgi:hypothetical protein